jgi:hypothetical protein
MVQKYIEQLIPVEEADQQWRYTTTGDTLELFIKAAYTVDEVHYRLGVIQIGQLIQKLEDLSTKQQITLQVQSFPDLNEPRLAARIRFRPMRKDLTSRSSVESRTNGHAVKKEPWKKQRALASHYGFTIHTADQLPRSTDQQIMERYSIDSHLDTASLHLLGSVSDHPFTWLKVGRWMVRALDLTPSGKSANEHLRYRLTADERLDLADQLEGVSYIQLIF